MAWTIFELLINLFQSSLILFYLKHCFSYEKKVLLADASFLVIFTAFLTLSQGVASISFFVQQIIFFSLVFCYANFFSTDFRSYLSKLCVQKGSLYHHDKRSPFPYSQADYPSKEKMLFSKAIRLCNLHFYIVCRLYR